MRRCIVLYCIVVVRVEDSYMIVDLDGLEAARLLGADILWENGKARLVF